MAQRPSRIIRIDQRARELRRQLGATDWLVLEELALQADELGGQPVAATTVRKLADVLGSDKDTVARSLRRLRSQGLVKFVYRAGYEIRLLGSEGLSVLPAGHEDAACPQTPDIDRCPPDGDSAPGQGRRPTTRTDSGVSGRRLPPRDGSGLTPRESQHTAAPAGANRSVRRARRTRPVADTQPSLFPDRHGIRSGPRPKRRALAWILLSEHLDKSRTGPGEQVDDEKRAQPSCCSHPFDLEIVEPLDELRVRRPIRWLRAVMPIPMPGQKTEVTAEKMTAQPEDGPLRAG